MSKRRQSRDRNGRPAAPQREGLEITELGENYGASIESVHSFQFVFKN